MTGDRIVEITHSNDRFESEILTEAIRAAGFQVELVLFEGETSARRLEFPAHLLVHESDLAEVQRIVDGNSGQSLILEPGFPKPLERHELQELTNIPELTFAGPAGPKALERAHWEWWQHADDGAGLTVTSGGISTAAELGPALELSDPLISTVHTGVLPTSLLLMGHTELTYDGAPATPDAPPLLIEVDLMGRESVDVVDVSYGAGATFTVTVGDIASDLTMIAVELEWLLSGDDFAHFELPLIRCTWAAMLT